MDDRSDLQWTGAVGAFEAVLLVGVTWMILGHRFTVSGAVVLVALTAASVTKLVAATVFADSQRINVAWGIATLLSATWLFASGFLLSRASGVDVIYYGLPVSALFLVVVGVAVLRGDLAPIPDDR